MNLTRWSRCAEWAVLAGVVGLHVLLMAWPAWRGEPGFLVSTLRETLPLCQPALVLAWAVWGPGRWWLRLVLAPVLLGLGLWWGTVPFLNMPDFDSRDFVPLVLALVATLALLRAGGLRVRAFGGRPDPPAQFSIRALILATTAIAAVIGLMEVLRPFLAGTQEMQQVLVFLGGPRLIELPDDSFTASTLRAAVLAASHAAIAVGAIALMLRPGNVWLRLTILAVAIPSLAAYLIQLIGVRDETLMQRIMELTVAFAALAFMTGVSALPLRLFDYRLCRPAPDPARATLWQRISRWHLSPNKPPATASASRVPETST